ncbi:LamG-like jellyroll fold domain-containing protein [Rubritalea sp.]|uniref:LamG-like jellyroll fold domain-containing protein n=1 Tax=Rubritalea sp. TaxID=2109375 RepID=UPI003EF18F0F
MKKTCLFNPLVDAVKVLFITVSSLVCSAGSATAEVAQSGDNPIVFDQTATTDNLVVLMAGGSAHNDELTVRTAGTLKHLWIQDFDDTSDYMQWTISLDTAADYHVDALLSANAGETFKVSVVETGESLDFSKDTGGWTKQDAGIISLPAGTSTLRLVRTSASGNVLMKALELIRESDRAAYEQRIADFKVDSTWFSQAGYGLMFQYGAWGYPESGDKKSIEDQANDFDVPAFVEMVKGTGASYVIWSSTWREYKINAPIASVDSYFGDSSHTSSRDLIGEVMDALDAEGIDFMLYYHRGEANEAPWFLDESFPRTEFTQRGTGDRSIFFDSWTTIIAEIGNRYGDKLDGWFIDGGMVYYPAPFERFGAAARAGNPNRLVSYNPWVAVRMTDFQDVMFGEDHKGTTITGSADAGGDGILTDGPSEGLLQHGMFTMENTWGVYLEDQAINTSITAANALSYVENAKALNVPLSFNMMMWEDGTVSQDSLDILAGIAETYRDPVASWALDSSSGTVAVDSSENAYDGTVANGTWVTGLDGSAIDFNGSSSSVTLPAAAFATIDDQITVAMWVYGDTTQARNDTLLYAADSSGNRVINIHLPWRNGNVYWDAGNTGSSFDRINKGASASAYKGQWNHWVFTKNANTGAMAIYLNGSLWHSGTGKSSSMANIAAVKLGSALNNSSYDGIIDEVQLYDRELSATEVSNLTYSYTTSNGTPKVWLVSNGIAPTDAGSLADADGDGLANWEEYQNGNDPLVADNPAGIRVTEYYLTSGDFSGTSMTLTLDQNLTNDYFILVRGSRDGNGQSMPDNDYVCVTGVPYGSNRYAGSMVGSGNNNLIKLERSASNFDWEGVVTVVECTNPTSSNGFDLIDIVSTEMVGSIGSDTCAAWSDINQVALFGGYRGGGVNYVGTPTSTYDNASAHMRLYPSGSNTIEWSRNAAGETSIDVIATTFVVEWGSEWNVQHATVSGSNGGNGANTTGEYTTVAIDPVARDNTWVWSTGTRADAGIGDGAEACLVTLGDGVNQNATESTVAVGSEYTDAYWFDVYTMTHPDLNVDYRFKADGDFGSTDLAVTVDTASAGARFGWVYNGCNGNGNYFPRPKLWSRYTADGEITLSRGCSGQNFPAWVQGINFSGLND